MTSIRPFAATDYPRLIEIHNRVYPEDQYTVKELRYLDDAWDHDRYFRSQVVAEDDGGQMIGFGALEHMPNQFHPDKYSLGITVDPPARRRGHGTALFDDLAGKLRARGAVAVRAWAKESEAEAQRFVTERGFVEARREWQSRLDVPGFDPAPFAGAMERIVGQGITLTSLAEESSVNERALPDVFALYLVCSRDVPDIDPFTAISFDDYLKFHVNAPYFIPEAYLLAKHGDQYVGMAWLISSEEEPDVLYQGLTGVIPEYRGKGVAMALKLAIVECAKSRGAREIRTWNDTMNRAMLRINEAMGFAKEPAEIVYLKDLTAAP
ncbi:MAG: GNAT family N-acetyltransferase [Chloroflexota bacterium]|nr:GNAT family N-acetyltransferase [Chloroflexota bacterium]